MKIGLHTKRKKQAEETKSRIIKSAFELMEEKGYDSLTIVDISRRAGVSVGTFYHHFQAKLDILAETLRMADDYYLSVCLPSITAIIAGERIIEFFDYYARFVIRQGINNARVIYNPHMEFLTSEDRPLFRIVEEMIASGQKESTIKLDITPKELANLLVIGARGVAFDWAAHKGKYDLEEKMHHYMELLVSSIKIQHPV